MCLRHEEPMACDSPSTAMTMLTCSLSDLLITLVDKKTHTHPLSFALFLVCTNVTSILAGVPQFS